MQTEINYSITTLEQGYAQRVATLTEWDEKFSKEKTDIVNAFANSIFQQIKDNVETAISNPLYSLYTQQYPLKAEYYLEAPHHISPLFKRQLKEDMLMSSLVKNKNDSENDEYKDIIVSSTGKKVLYKEESLPLRINYEDINQRLSAIGLATKEVLEKKLTHYQCTTLEAHQRRTSNQYLRFKVEWQGNKGESSDTSSWSKSSSYGGIYAKIWFDFKEAATKNSQPEKKKTGFWMQS
jgi:hypothetical protein